MSGLSPHAHPAPNSSIFRPPQSPACSPSMPSKNPDYFSSSHRSRKRARPDSVDWTGRLPSASTPLSSTVNTPAFGWVQCPTPSDGVYGSAGTAGTGLVNERYRLKDGFDTPGLLAGSMENEQSHNAIDRGRMSGDGLSGLDRSDRSVLSGPLARERNGIARVPSSSRTVQRGKGWAGYAFGLVGKVFSFGTGVFRGFYAGGGQGYQVSDTPAPSRPQLRPRISRTSTPVPGAWQDDEFLGDFEQDNPSSPPTSCARPANKRRQTDKDSWVMVGMPDSIDCVSSSSPSSTVASSNLPRTNSASRPTASRAANRRSLMPVSRRQSSYTTSNTGSPAHATHARPQSADMSRRASFAPMRSNSRPSSSHSASQQQAYVSPEAERFVKRQAKQDRAADKAMSSMSKQLQDLIRQGQEALGTKVDVEGGEDQDMELDEGFVDEEKNWR